MPFQGAHDTAAPSAERVVRGLGMLALGVFGLAVGAVIGVLVAFWTGLLVLQC